LFFRAIFNLTARQIIIKIPLVRAERKMAEKMIQPGHYPSGDKWKKIDLNRISRNYGAWGLEKSAFLCKVV